MCARHVVDRVVEHRDAVPVVIAQVTSRGQSHGVQVHTYLMGDDHLQRRNVVNLGSHVSKQLGRVPVVIQVELVRVILRLAQRLDLVVVVIQVVDIDLIVASLGIL